MNWAIFSLLSFPENHIFLRSFEGVEFPDPIPMCFFSLLRGVLTSMNHISVMKLLDQLPVLRPVSGCH